MHQTRLLLFGILGAFAAVSGLAAEYDRDFSGVWKLNPDRSDLRGLPNPPFSNLRIEHDEATIRIVSQDAGQPASWAYSTTGKTTKHKIGDTSFSNATKWEGAALLVNSIVSGPQSYSRNERWKVSRNRRSLTVAASIVRASGETEYTLVYDRADLPPEQPQLITRAAEPTATETPKTVAPTPEVVYVVPAGTQIPLRLLSTVSSKVSNDGDRVYLTTEYPIMAGGRIVIPPGSAVSATVTEVERPGRVRGRGSFFLRFDSLTLPNGVTRSLRSRPSASDPTQNAELDKAEGEMKGGTNKSGDARTVATTTAAGATIGSAAGRSATGAGIGAAAGAAAGLAGVLLSRGPGATLAKGATIEMTLDRDLQFGEKEIATTSR